MTIPRGLAQASAPLQPENQELKSELDLRETPIGECIEEQTED